MPDSEVQPERHTPNHLEYVGIIASAWATLEMDVDSTSCVLAGIPHEVGACFTANLGSIHLKLRTLRALVELRGGSKKLLTSITAYQGKISGTAEKRNRAVHDPWMASVSPEGVAIGQWVNRADNKGREFGHKNVAIDVLMETNREIMKRINQFFELREKIKNELPAYAGKLS